MPVVTDIFLLGTGTRFRDQITLEVLEVLDECEKVFTLLSEEEIVALPKGIAEKCESVWLHYRQERKRDDNYKEVAVKVFTAAQLAAPVAWLTRGNPRILDSVSQMLIDMAVERGLSVEALPSVSAIDSVLVDVGYDPAGGILVVEATAALMMRTPFVPEVAALIFQPGVFGTLYPRLTRNTNDISLARLRDYLLEFYPAGHSTALVASSRSRALEPMIVWTTVGELGDVPQDALLGSTMFIPPARNPPIDQKFLAAVLEAL